ncbi:MAG: alpha/beta hydrolase [Leptotrichiaceae bacterium]|nr:alpha/beta hydrolase [Leptotrichiaceae bacterium]
MEKRYFESFDGTQIPYLYFRSNRGEQFKNDIVILHGVAEPVSRYEEFGNFLCANGYNVFIPEIRGHGELKTGEIGDFGKYGINGVFKDIDIFFEKELLPRGVKPENTTIFGHSMGALITAQWVIENNYKYFVLSGFPLKKKSDVFKGKLLSVFERMLVFKKKSFFNKEFKKYNAFFAPNQTKFDWLTRNTEEARKYEESDFCGYPLSTKVFSGILKVMGFINGKYKKIRTDANILIVHGTEDRAMDIEHVNKILSVLRKKKRRINIIANDKGRHESLNEINKYMIYDEILKWLNEREK